MNTMSVTSSNEDSLSTILYGGGNKFPTSPISTRRGPSAPICSHNEPAPGPPLNANVIGRFVASCTSSRVYATKNTLAFGVPSSSLSSIVPAVAVYLISCPPIRTACLVCTLFSSGAGFFSSLGFSAVLSAGFSPLGCCALAKLAPTQKTNTEKRKRKRLNIAGKASQKRIVSMIAPAKSYATPLNPSITQHANPSHVRSLGPRLPCGFLTFLYLTQG